MSAEHSQTAVLSRVPALDQLSRETAEFILRIELSPEDVGRLNELAEKARRGDLSADEQRDLDEYRRAGRVVEMFKLKAQMALQREEK